SKVRIIVPLAGTPVGVVNLITWLATVLAVKLDTVSDREVKLAAIAMGGVIKLKFIIIIPRIKTELVSFLIIKK
ncbi:MAG: hypothetical protein US34_C0001G0001, partial [Candidatus Nomurabacteria bacterium GW2011_GWC2_36_9]